MVDDGDVWRLNMPRIGQQYRQGTWTINEKNIPAFIEAWQASTHWILERATGQGEAILLQDSEEPTRFISFAYSLNPEDFAIMRQDDFQELWTAVMALVEDVLPHNMRLVGHAGR